ncbi:MAG TPA: glycosyltransferase [Polyangiaceae bacterium]
MQALAWLLVASATLWTAGALAAIVVFTRRRIPSESSPSPVSVLKPLCGRDADLESNLASFFEQDHPNFELVFGAIDADDPALKTVSTLRARYPKVKCKVIVHAGGGSLNPKVNNLRGMLPAASHDLVVVSDSNIKAPRQYVRELATLFDAEGPGLVTNLFAGTGEDSFGAALENVQLTGFCAAGVALPTLLGDPLLVGKSSAFSRARFEQLGGFQRLADVLAEDFVMGKTFAHAGDRVLVAPTILSNVTRSATLEEMLARHLRWAMMRFRLRPTVAALEPLTSPLALLPLCWWLLGPWSLAWAAALLIVRDVGGWVALRGWRRWYLPLLLSPIRELVALGIWALAPLKHRVSWRGKRFRLGAGTLLYPEQR